MYSDTYKTRPKPHAGMGNKPLHGYDPNAYRNRLMQAEVVMPYKNSSQITIGDRSSFYSRQFVTTNSNVFTNPKQMISPNTGITAAHATKTKLQQGQ